MPIPTASLAVCSVVLIFNDRHPFTKMGIIGFSLYIILISLLMISNIKFKTVKKFAFKNSLKTLFLLALIVGCLISFPDPTIPILTFSYMLSPLFFFFFGKKHKNAEATPEKTAEVSQVGKTEA
jgi:phosphatidylserine synthase